MQFSLLCFTHDCDFWHWFKKSDINKRVSLPILPLCPPRPSPDTTMTAGTTAAVRTRATSSRSPSPSSPWAWANSSSLRPLHPPPFPQPTLRPLTPATACFPCRSASGCASITTRAGCTSTTQTPCGAFMRGRWIVQEQCIQPSASWAAARCNWRSSSRQRDWPSEPGWSLLLR